MTRSDLIERRERGVPAGSGDNRFRQRINRRQKGTAITLQLIITAAVSLLIGISIGIIAIHLLTGAAPGLDGQWRQYVRF